MIFLSVVSEFFNGLNDTLETIVGLLLLIVGGAIYGIYVFFRNRRRTKENPDWELEEELDEVFDSINGTIAELESEDFESMEQSPKECFREMNSLASQIKMKFLKFKSQEHKEVYKENYNELLSKIAELQETYKAKGLFDKFNSPKIQRPRIIKQLNEEISSIESNLSDYLTKSKEEGRDFYKPSFSEAETLLSRLESISEADDSDVAAFSKRIGELKQKYETGQGGLITAKANQKPKAGTGKSDKASQPTSDEYIRRKKIMVQHGIDIKVDGSWGPWLQKQWDATKQKYNVE